MTDSPSLPPCPSCHSIYTYQNGQLLVCPECAYEWAPPVDEPEPGEFVVRDVNGTLLVDGDTVTLIKDLRVRRLSSIVDR